MAERRIYDGQGHAHFVTFSCYKRRRLLDHDRAKCIVLGTLHAQLRRLNGRCAGFVIMPNHVHAILWFPLPDQLSEAKKQWKRISSYRIKGLGEEVLRAYWKEIESHQPIWQAKYYGFNLYSDRKVEEKLAYMHNNPVRAGLAARPIDWRWSSARWYECRKSVGIPVAPLE